MKAEANRQTTIILELEEVEARWLRDLMQNPVCSSEPTDTTHMRSHFWEVLNECIEEHRP